MGVGGGVNGKCDDDLICGAIASLLNCDGVLSVESATN